jgi:hypothetical protein
VRKCTKILSLVACATCVALALGKLTGEPHYKGVSLTKWLTVYRASAQRFWIDLHPESSDYESPEATAAADAVRAIHSQALPVLVRWMRFEPPSWWKTSLFDYAATLPGGLQNRAPVKWLNPDRGYERLELALTGFVILGSNAAPAIPALTKIAGDPAGPGSVFARRALCSMGAPAVPALTNLLATASPQAKDEIRIAFARMGADAQAAIPTLIQDLADSDRVVAGRSAWMLGRIGLEPQLVVPALMRALEDRRDSVRQSAVFALRNYGDAARPAVPKLQDLLGDDAPLVQREARETLQAITTEALTNAPVQ